MDTQNTNGRGLGWSIFFLVLGISSLAGYFFKPSHAVHDLLRGAGLLLIVPQAYLHPPKTPLKIGGFKAKLQMPTYWLAIIGAVLVLAGLIGEWL